MEIVVLVLLILLLTGIGVISVLFLNKISELSKNINDLSQKFTTAQKAFENSEKNIVLTEQNEKLKSKHIEYKQFFSIVLDVLNEDTKFIRSEFFRRFGAVPEYQDINSQILSFESKVESVKEALREQRILENYDE